MIKILAPGEIQTRSFFITGLALYRFATITAIFIEGIGSKELVFGWANKCPKIRATFFRVQGAVPTDMKL